MRNIFRCNSGMSMVEFGLLLPVLITLLLGTIEVSRYALLNLKLDKTANAMADFLTQSTVPRIVELDSYASSAGQILRPFPFLNGQGSIIFTSIYFRDVGVPPCEGVAVSCIAWQYRPTGSDASRVGSVGGNANLPGTYGVLSGQNAITAEVFYNYEPLFAFSGSVVTALAPHKMYKLAVYKPRQGTMFDPPT